MGFGQLDIDEVPTTGTMLNSYPYPFPPSNATFIRKLLILAHNKKTDFTPPLVLMDSKLLWSHPKEPTQTMLLQQVACKARTINLIMPCSFSVSSQFYRMSPKRHASICLFAYLAGLYLLMC